MIAYVCHQRFTDKTPKEPAKVLLNDGYRKLQITSTNRDNSTEFSEPQAGQILSVLTTARKTIPRISSVGSPATIGRPPLTVRSRTITPMVINGEEHVVPKQRSPYVRDANREYNRLKYERKI